MQSICRDYCLAVMQLSESLIELAQGAHIDCDEDQCLVLSGIILDSASLIRREAEKRLKKLETES
jgi:hypothetical protein